MMNHVFHNTLTVYNKNYPKYPFFSAISAFITDDVAAPIMTLFDRTTNWDANQSSVQKKYTHTFASNTGHFRTLPTWMQAPFWKSRSRRG